MLNSKLYVVATPIGNFEDITLRALKVLKEVDLIICEEIKTARRLLSYYDIKDKELFPLNEHNERDHTKDLFERFLNEDLTAALISEAGTPLFADPGNHLIKKCNEMQIQVIPVPGASSLMAALSVSGLKLDQFLYYGFLPANRQERIAELKKVSSWANFDIVFFDAPYRLKQLLRDMASVIGRERWAMIFYKLTYDEQRIFDGPLDSLQKMTENLPKGEFIVILKKNRRRRWQKK